MAHLLRLIAVVFLALLSLSAHALIPAGTGYKVSGSPDSTARATYAEACTAFVAHMNTVDAAKNYRNPTSLEPQGYGCRYIYDNPGPTQNVLSFVTVASICPANSSPATGGCVCNAPYVENSAHTACEAPPDPCKALKGQSAGTWWKDTGDDNGLPAKVGFSVCDKYQSAGGGLCVATAPSRTTLCVQTEGGWWRCSGEAFYTGSTAATPSKCSESGPGGSGDDANNPMPSTPPVGLPPMPPPEPKPGTAAPAPCPAGQAPGTVNGTSVCKPTGNDRPTVADAPGNGATTTNNSDGSSTTSTTSGTTKCAEGQCTTTTNTTNITTNAPGNNTCPSGQTSGTTTVGGQTRTTCTGTGSGTSSQAQSGFCEKNPKDKQCGGDGADTSFGGTCAAGFKAQSDDAVINAMAEETFRQNCKVNPADSETTLAAAERVKTGNQTGDNPNNASFSISPASIDTSDAIGGGGGCISDKVISIGGGSVALPFSRACDSFPMLGNLLVAISFLVAAVIIMRG